MDVRSYSHARQHLKDVMDEVCRRRAPVIISRQKSESVVMMSLDEVNAIEETLHLLRSPRNAERLLKSIEHAQAGELEEHPLTDDR